MNVKTPQHIKREDPPITDKVQRGRVKGPTPENGPNGGGVEKGGSDKYPQPISSPEQRGEEHNPPHTAGETQPPVKHPHQSFSQPLRTLHIPRMGADTSGGGIKPVKTSHSQPRET